jgi:hypothetical protein
MTTRFASKGALLVAVGLLIFSGVPMVLAQSASSFNNVQIFVNTGADLPYSYTFSAYNQTGSLVGTYQSSYPAAGFELPTGDYLFTVSASQWYNSCMGCYYAYASSPASGEGTTRDNTTTVTITSTTTASKSTSTSPYIAIFQQSSEYGYAVESVNGPATYTIQTQNVTLLPTTPLNVKVTYVNGTVAVGAYVSASIVGQNYYWWGFNPNTIMSNTTDSFGVAHLVLPNAPAVVSAWAWIPVNLPPSNNTGRPINPPEKNGTVPSSPPVSNGTGPVDIGGQKINITTYWETTYVGLSASTTIIPPYGDVSLTLQYQQPESWIRPMGVSNQPTGVPSTVQSNPSKSGSDLSQPYLPSAIPLINGSMHPTGTAPNYGLIVMGAVVVAAILVGLITMTAIRARTRSQDK